MLASRPVKPAGGILGFEKSRLVGFQIKKSIVNAGGDFVELKKRHCEGNNYYDDRVENPRISLVLNSREMF